MPVRGVGDLPSLPVLGKGAPPCVSNGCSACCHDVEMLLTEADVARIGSARPGVSFWFRAEDGYLQLKTRGGRPAPGSSGRPCVFLGPEGACSIHPIRPAGCRLYPAVLDDPLPQAVLDAEYCPHTDGFWLTPEMDTAVQDLAETLNRERDARVG